MTRGTLKSLFLPGGAILIAFVVLLSLSWLRISAAAMSFYYVASFVGALLLAWRFHSTRIFFTALTVLLAERALTFYSAAPPASPAPAHAAFVSLATLLPLNFLAFTLVKERGFTVPAVASRLFLVFLESVYVAVVCRPDHAAAGTLLGSTFIDLGLLKWTPVPQIALAFYGMAGLVLLFRFLTYRKAVESGSFWALTATLLAFQARGTTGTATGYLGTAALILLSAVVESSYVMAYNDELTGLLGRRAFNETLLGLDNQYAIAVVDIDHFKKFNDTYGHETGDEVLRMVASRLQAVSGGGKAFRCGGEEFAIIFPEKSAKEAFEHLEVLRRTVESSAFRVRGHLDRRKVPRPVEDRRRAPGKSVRRIKISPGDEVTVTISVGVAEPGTKNREAEQVINAADKALYRAKEAGRNRVEVDGPESRRNRAARSGR